MLLSEATLLSLSIRQLVYELEISIADSLGGRRKKFQKCENGRWVGMAGQKAQKTPETEFWFYFSLDENVTLVKCIRANSCT